MEVTSVVGVVVVICQVLTMIKTISKINNPMAASLFSWLGLFFAGMAIAIAFSGANVVVTTSLISGAMMNIYSCIYI